MLANSTSDRRRKISAFPEDLGVPVAVVDVPVKDQDPVDAKLADRQLSRNRDVVEQAEAHRAVPLGVLA
jgi:hypothetical protein